MPSSKLPAMNRRSAALLRSPCRALAAAAGATGLSPSLSVRWMNASGAPPVLLPGAVKGDTRQGLGGRRATTAGDGAPPGRLPGDSMATAGGTVKSNTVDRKMACTGVAFA